MIYMEPQTLGWRPLVKSWLAGLAPTFSEAHKKIINDLFERFVDPCLALVRKRTKELSPPPTPISSRV
jgi:dynein heavy chain